MSVNKKKARGRSDTTARAEEMGFYFFLSGFPQMCPLGTHPCLGHLTFPCPWGPFLAMVLMRLSLVVEDCASDTPCGRCDSSARIYEPVLIHSCRRINITNNLHKLSIDSTSSLQARSKQEKTEDRKEHSHLISCWLFHPFGGFLRLR